MRRSVTRGSVTRGNAARGSVVARTASRVAAMAGKETAHIVRDPQMLLFALAMPVVLLLLFGYAVSFDIEHIPLAVVDQDRSAASRGLVARFSSADTFEVVARPAAPEDAEPLLRRGIAKAALVIPPGFARAVGRGERADTQLLLDGADGTTASVALGYSGALALAATGAELDAVEALLGADATEPIAARVRTLFNPGLRSAVFLVPGLMVIILVMVAVMLTALTVAREYERGSMEQLFATPVGRLEIVLGKLGPYFVIGVVQVLLVLTVGVGLFDVPVNGSLTLLFAVAAVFLLAMLMQGLVISTITRNQMVASQVALISTFLPAMLLSGFVYPIDGMPAALQAIASALPARYLVHAMRAILLRGNGLESVGGDIAAMAAFFAVMLAIAVAKFRRAVA